MTTTNATMTTTTKVKGTGFKWGQELTKWKVAYTELQEQLALTQHDLNLANQHLEKYADEYAGHMEKKDEEIEKLKALLEEVIDDGNDQVRSEYDDILVEKDEEIEKLKAEIEAWKQADKKREKSKARKPATETIKAGQSIPLHPYYQTAMDAMEKEIEELKAEKRPINFDDANMEFYWAAQNGDVIFWKVPVAIHDIADKDGTSRVLELFQGNSMGEEWGCLSSHTIRTMDMATFKELRTESCCQDSEDDE